MFIFICTDIFICLYWLISFTLFNSGLAIQNDSSSCFESASLYIIVLIFQFSFYNCILYQFKLISTNPITGILKPIKKISIYVLISLILSLSEYFLCFLLNVIGKSVSINYLYIYIAINNLFYSNKGNRFK
jgi:hypothetical protein